MAAQLITTGALDAIFNDPERAQREFPVPVLQCLQVKLLEAKGPGGGERYRLILSDINSYCQCMLATQATSIVHEGLLQRGAIIRLKSYQAQHIKERSVLIVLDVEVITDLGTPDKIGDPKPVDIRPGGGPQNTTIGGAGFYGAKTEPTQDSKTQVQRQIAASRNTGGGGGGGSNAGPGGATIYPIEALSMYSHKWTIKARVTQKSDIKTWHKSTGEGKLFSVNLLDESGEIRATGFNDQVDQFYELLQEGGVYYISTPCRVQLAKKQFTNLANDYELTLERDTQIEKAEDQSNVPQVRFNFCTISELQSVEKDATVDVIGVLKEVQEVSQITSKTTNKGYDKRELTIVDNTGYSVRVTVWGKTATNFDAQPESIIAFKGTKVSDFGGRSLSLLSSGTMSIDPDISEAYSLKGWWDSAGKSENFASHSGLASVGAATGRKDDLKTILAVKTEGLGMNEAPDYFSVVGTIVYIYEQNFAYPACQNEGCNKKVTDNGDGTWRCEKCNMNHDRPQWRYIMSVSINDHTGQLRLSCFDEHSRVIMGGKSADELMEMKDTGEDAAFSAEFEAANCKKYIFRVRAKMDTYGDQQRVRYQVMGITRFDYKSEGLKLADMIKQMSL